MKRCLLSLLILSSTSAFSATPINGWYAGAFGGYTNMPNNLNKLWVSLNRTDAHYDAGYHAGLRLGYKSTPLRYEGELTYLTANINAFKINGYPQYGVSGDTYTNLFMANVYYDFPDMLPCLNPFLGLGLGYAFVNTNLFSNGPFFGPTRLTGSNGVFAYQGTAGVNYDFSEFWSLNASYRYVSTERVEILGKAVQANLLSLGVVYRFDEALYK